MLVQLCMGAFLFTYETTGVLDSIVRDRWFEEGIEARQLRVDYQNFYECCGWSDPFDSRASGYNTPCPIASPTACRDETLDWLGENYTPAAIFAISFALIQLVAVLATVMLLMKGKNHDHDDWIPW
mmetsp:Transcript_1452/g.2064  ORF Transcript_1452/g.2064 Transcript_1452/m.2064 type:complete len:126 (+) Transcript_1452:545-922(+)